MSTPFPYAGYLANHIARIRAMYEGGASTREIAEALYAAGVRARPSDPYDKLDRSGHLRNLRGTTIYVLRRLGLRTRRVRILNLTATEMKLPAGGRPGASKSVNDDDEHTMLEKHHATSRIADLV
jgi:hypothetical protein